MTSAASVPSPPRSSWPSGDAPSDGQLEVRVAAEEVLERVAGFGRIEQVGREHGVDREPGEIDVVGEQTAHQRLGAVGGDVAIGQQIRERDPDVGVSEQSSVDPRHLARAAVDDQRESDDLRPTLRSGPRRGERERCGGGTQRIDQRDRIRRLRDPRDFGLEHVRVGGRTAEILGERLGQPVVERPELEEVEQASDFFGVGLRRRDVVEADVELDIAQQHHDLGVAPRPLLVLGQVLTQLRRLVVGVGEDAVEPAVGRDQLRRGLLADARHARQVVRRIASQRRVLDVLGGRDAGALLDAGLVVERVVGHASAVVQHLDVRVFDELVGVAVAGDDEHVVATVTGLGGQRGDDVVGFGPGQLDGADAERLDDLVHEPELLAQDVRRRLPVRLVVLDLLVAERRLGPVERDRDRVGLVIPDQVDEHRGEPEHRVGHLARRGDEIRRQGVERAIGQRVPVDQHELLHHVDRTRWTPTRSRRNGRADALLLRRERRAQGVRSPSRTRWAMERMV